MPIVEFSTKRTTVSLARPKSPCRVSLAKISGARRLFRKSRTELRTGIGQRGAIGLSHRHQHMAVDHLVEVKDFAVGVFKRIVEIFLGGGRRLLALRDASRTRDDQRAPR